MILQILYLALIRTAGRLRIHGALKVVGFGQSLGRKVSLTISLVAKVCLTISISMFVCLQHRVALIVPSYHPLWEEMAYLKGNLRGNNSY